MHDCHALHLSSSSRSALQRDIMGGIRRADPHSSDELSDELPAVAARRSIHGYAEQAALAVPCCIGNQKLLCMDRVLQRQPRKFQVHPHI